MEFLPGHWLWLLLGLGAVWFLLRRGGMGCGTRGHRSHGSHGSQESEDAQGSGHSHNGDGSGELKLPRGGKELAAKVRLGELPEAPGR